MGISLPEALPVHKVFILRVYQEPVIRVGMWWTLTFWHMFFDFSFHSPFNKYTYFKNHFIELYMFM